MDAAGGGDDLVSVHQHVPITILRVLLGELEPEAAFLDLVPKAEVFERYRSLGIGRLRNDEAGAITLQFGATLSVSEYRSEHARYWYGR